MYTRLVVFALTVSAAALALAFGALPAVGGVSAQAAPFRAWLPLVPRNVVLDYAPSTSGTISGTIRAENVTVPSGVTLTTAGATTIQANGDVALSGAIVTDGTDLTIVAGGNVTIAGPISIASGATVAEESGKVVIRAGGKVRIGTEGDDPSQVLIRAADIDITTTGTAPSRSAQQINSNDDFIVFRSMTANAGAAGANDIKVDAPAVGKNGRRGGRMNVDTSKPNGTIGVIPGVVLTAGAGGKGGDAVSQGSDGCPGGSATATGGRGGLGGSVSVGSTAGVLVQMRGSIVVGDGGPGGNAIAQPGNGNQPGCLGGGGQATGGDGGNGGAFSTAGRVALLGTNVSGGNGGAGGKGTGQNGGLGADGAFPADGNGAKGGAVTIRGGTGGDGGGYATEGAAAGGRGGVGGDAAANAVSNGGTGANGCAVDPKRVGGNGGEGGMVSVVGGNGGIHYRNAGQAAGGNGSATNSGNGGNGGDGLPNGGTGGAGGGFTVIGGGAAINGSFQRGADGAVCAIAMIDPACAASGENRTLVLTGFAAGEQVAVTFTHEGESFGDTFVVGADGSLERTIFVTSGQSKTFAVAAVGRTSGKRATTSIRSVVGEACPPQAGRTAATAGARM